MNPYMKAPISASQYSLDEKCSFMKNTASLTLSYSSTPIDSSIILKYFNENISLDDVFTYLQPLLTLFSFQDILENLFPKKSNKKTNNKLQYYNCKNPMVQLILLFKGDYFLSAYRISSQLHYLYHLLRLNLHYQKILKIVKKKDETIQREINTTISSPSRIEPFHIHQKNVSMSIKTQSNNLNSNCNDFFGTWFVFCCLYSHDILLNYFTVDVRIYYY